ncbi:MAG: hypothetical protein JJU46_06900 [Balneolaceae bacterium]|nr:hypothetical protein [Balneolaceae bacterium]MCH8548271.1 hypothetical protein [Balneolaceae bacterium]
MIIPLTLLALSFGSINNTEIVDKDELQVPCNQEVYTEIGCRNDWNVTYKSTEILLLGFWPKRITTSACESGGSFQCPLDYCPEIDQSDEEES